MGKPFVTEAQLERAIQENKVDVKPSDVVNIVNTAIENGDIQIPAGGTKLYKHTLSQTSGPSLDLVIINTSSDAITLDNIGNIDILSVKSSGNNYYNIVKSGPSELKLLFSYSMSSYQPSAGTITIYGSLVDIVTEL